MIPIEDNWHAVQRSLASGASVWNGMFAQAEGQNTTFY